MTPSEIEPATFRFVAQCVNQLSYRVTINTMSERHANFSNANTGGAYSYRCSGLLHTHLDWSTHATVAVLVLHAVGWGGGDGRVEHTASGYGRFSMLG